jgi:hypothetical protein
MQSTNSDGPPEKLDQHGTIPTYFPEHSTLPWPRFRDLLEDYTNCHLSYNNDVFNACTGLYHFVYGARQKRLIFGTPEADFCDALRWYARWPTARVPEDPDFVLPSWSWGSNKGSMLWFRGDGWKSGDTSEEGPTTVPLVKFLACLGEDQGWSVLDSLGRDGMTPERALELKWESQDPVAQPAPVPGRLCFRTQTARFRLCGEVGCYELENDKEYLQLEIEHPEKYRVGTITVSLDWALKYCVQRCTSRCYRPEHDIYPSNTRENAKKMYERGWNQCVHMMRREPFKFVLVSAADIPPHWTISTLERYCDAKDPRATAEVDSYLDKLEPDHFYRTAGDSKDLHVMLVEGNENGDIANRVGVTNLRLDDWFKCKPKMEDIILE